MLDPILNDKDLSHKIDAALSDSPAAPDPPKAPETPVPGEPAQKADTPPTASDTPPADQPAKKEDAPLVTDPPKVDDPPPALDPPVLLADKFQTPDALERGVNELVKSLKVPFEVKFFIDEHIKKAKSTKDFSELEDTYKKLQVEFSRRSEAGKRTADEPEQIADAQASDEEFVRLTAEEEARFVQDETMRALQADPVMAELRRQGLDLPTNANATERQHWIDDMKTNHPVLFVDLREAIARISRGVSEFVQKAYKDEEDKKTFLSNELPNLTKSAREKGEQFINEFNKQHPIGLKPEDVSKIVEDALKDHKFLTDQKGVKVPTDTSVRDYFLINVVPARLPAAIQDAEMKGRNQHAEDLKAMQKKVLDAPSTSQLSKTVPRQTPKVDLTKPEDVAGLSDADVNSSINKIFS